MAHAGYGLRYQDAGNLGNHANCVHVMYWIHRHYSGHDNGFLLCSNYGSPGNGS